MSFGADSDYWSFGDTKTKLISSSRSLSKSEAQAVDSNGDVAASAIYDTFAEITCTYERCADAVRLFKDTTTSIDFRIGKVISGNMITSIEVATENASRPKYTISGRTCIDADSAVQKYPVDLLEISGARKATATGGTVAANNKLVSCTTSISGNFVAGLDSNGQGCWADVHGGRAESTLNFVGTSAAPSATADTGWTLLSGPSVDQENTGYGTGSITVFQNLATTGTT